MGDHLDIDAANGLVRVVRAERAAPNADVWWLVAPDRHKALTDTLAIALIELSEGRARVAELVIQRRIIAALDNLVVRLWTDDRPTDSTTASIDTWLAGLPDDEAAALNAVLGECYDAEPAWGSDHPISEWVRDHAWDWDGEVDRG